MYLGNGHSSDNNRFRAVDNAGNPSEWTSSVHIHMDTEAPKHTNWWWGEVNTSVARLYIQTTDNVGISRVTAPTSTQSGGYNNWVWFDAVWDSGANAYRADITPATFGHYGQTYTTHLYIYDHAGNGGYYNQTTVNIPYVPREIGDEVTVGGEQFYVLEWDNSSDVALLMAKYNLNKDGTAQLNAASDSTECKFSSTNYWSSSFTSSPFNLNDLSGYTSTDAMGKAKSYGTSKGAVSSRLLSYEEANALKTKASSDTKIATMLWGKANTNGYLRYWLGSALDTDYVWNVFGEYSTLNYANYDYYGLYGVRPVITVLKSSIS